jgi:hypothetical protein
MARLHALMGETRCGSPQVIDSWQPGAFAMKGFMPGPESRTPIPESRTPNPESRVMTALRRFRYPLPIRVHVKQGRPASVSIMRRGLSGGVVDSCAGPWRTSGGWWQSPKSKAESPEPRAQSHQCWDRDEWDVALADGPTYRLSRERHSDKWFIEGVVD